MNTQSNNNSKKYIVYTLMLICFCGIMWLIFSPSEQDQEVKGVNTNLPDPSKDGIIGNKKVAYEQAQLREKQQEQMQSLDDYQLMITKDKDSTILPNKEEMPEPVKEKTNSLKSSANAYHDLNRTLGSFYEPSKEDKAKEELQKQVDELQARLNSENSRQGVIDEQVALIEKSYELATRHFPQTQATTGNVGNSEKIKVTPITQVRNDIVSTLAQTMSNVGFNSAITTANECGKNTISVVVHSTQTITDGQSVRLRLTEAMLAGESYIPVNTMLTGVCKVQGERLDVLVSSLEYAGKLITVEMTAYDSDGQRGIYIPGSMEMNAVKEIVANMGGNLGGSINISQQKAGEQLLTDLGRGVIQGTSQYISKKVSQVRVRLKAGHKFFLLPKNN